MSIRFTKMHGLGNDYIYVDAFRERVGDPPALARAISDRHRGVGSDGLILIGPPEGADAHVRMRMFNADGSEAQVCGNGIRCVGKYAYERGLARANPLRVQTGRGDLELLLEIEGTQTVRRVRVDMGEPILEAARIPVRLLAADGTEPRPGAPEGTEPRPGAPEGTEPRRQPVETLGQQDRLLTPKVPARWRGGSDGEPVADSVIAAPLRVGDRILNMTCVSMGNPHAVFFVDALADVPLAEWGPLIERHERFPERVNAHFVQVRDRTYVEMVTWERGSGATQACGTGACAVCVAGVLNDRTERSITARLPGGELELRWDAETQHVFMTGPATEVCDGIWPGEW